MQLSAKEPVREVSTVDDMILHAQDFNGAAASRLAAVRGGGGVAVAAFAWSDADTRLSPSSRVHRSGRRDIPGVGGSIGTGGVVRPQSSGFQRAVVLPPDVGRYRGRQAAQRRSKVGEPPCLRLTQSARTRCEYRTRSQGPAWTKALLRVATTVDIEVPAKIEVGEAHSGETVLPARRIWPNRRTTSDSAIPSTSVATEGPEMSHDTRRLKARLKPEARGLSAASVPMALSR